MEDVIKDFKEKICIFCCRHECKQCMSLQVKEDKKNKDLQMYKFY